MQQLTSCSKNPLLATKSAAAIMGSNKCGNNPLVLVAPKKATGDNKKAQQLTGGDRDIKVTGYDKSSKQSQHSDILSIIFMWAIINW